MRQETFLPMSLTITRGEDRKNGARRDRILKGLLNSSGSAEFDTDMVNAHIDAPRRRDILCDESVYSLVSTMIQSPESNRKPLGLLFTMLTVDDLPPALQDRFPSSRSDVALQTHFNSWELCPETEERFQNSTREGTNIVVEHAGDPALLLKMRGLLTALCVEPVVTAAGNVFIPGNWYSPVDKTTREDFKLAFDAGDAHVDLRAGSSWALMRPLRLEATETSASVLAAVRESAATASIPKGFPVAGLSVNRNAYRKMIQEV